jgi:hypothetical protein
VFQRDWAFLAYQIDTFLYAVQEIYDLPSVGLEEKKPFHAFSVVFFESTYDVFEQIGCDLHITNQHVASALKLAQGVYVMKLPLDRVFEGFGGFLEMVLIHITYFTEFASLSIFFHSVVVVIYVALSSANRTGRTFFEPCLNALRVKMMLTLQQMPRVLRIHVCSITYGAHCIVFVCVRTPRKSKGESLSNIFLNFIQVVNLDLRSRHDSRLCYNVVVQGFAFRAGDVTPLYRELSFCIQTFDRFIKRTYLLQGGIDSSYRVVHIGVACRVHVGHHEGAMIGIDTMSHFGGHTVRTFEQTESLVVIESAGKSSNSGRNVETESNPIRTVPTSVRARMT